MEFRVGVGEWNCRFFVSKFSTQRRKDAECAERFWEVGVGEWNCRFFVSKFLTRIPEREARVREADALAGVSRRGAEKVRAACGR